MILTLAFTQVFAISLFLVARRLSDIWPCLKANAVVAGNSKTRLKMILALRLQLNY